MRPISVANFWVIQFDLAESREALVQHITHLNDELPQHAKEGAI